MNNKPPVSIDTWLEEVRLLIEQETPELLSIFDVYSNEAHFGRQYISSKLLQLPLNARILEVGAGSLLLSCQLMREGFRVTALEPIDSGFSHLKQVQTLVLNYAEHKGIAPRLLEQTAENLTETNTFDYAFSINVMEHVNDINKVILNVGRSLKSGALYHFTCPNYLFPYEPHFNIPTLLSKKLTEKVFAKKIFKNLLLPDPKGTWESLNWINTIKIKNIINSSKELKVTFNKQMLVKTLERVAIDKEFAKRRSKWVCIIITAIVKLRLHLIAGFSPASVQPIIDCAITRRITSKTL